MSRASQPTDGRNPKPPASVRDNPVLRVKAWNKMNIHDDNWMAAVVGETGSGKSWAALRIAEVLDPNFGIDQVAFSVEEFLRLVIDDSYNRGSIIVFEEASVGANAQEWYTKGNKVLGRVLDTWRHQNRGAIFTLPAFGQLTKNARGRMSALIQMQAKFEDEGYTTAKYKWIDQDTDTGKLYKKYPRIGGKKYKHLKVTKPSRELREAYEKKKEQFTNELNKELLEELIEEKEDAEESEDDDPHAIAEEIVSNNKLPEFIGDNHGQKYIDKDLIALEYDVGMRRAKQIKKLIQREAPNDVL
ncbi:hypothetical protein ELS19_06170 [Halogeometricum borinquense]|uniref:Uncharacterized protein n=1 Tax=Halogeometricum borinquense TaxID=60847 RepID=A0A482TJQ9_9EURY|nr:hypothetical protein [Halogeometricum borinquense]RYJ13581.1 hypothetical protein ELS19_06170 [Halogeometricum borinquense]